MLLAVDIGNARIKWGVFRGEKLAARRELASEPGWTDDQYACALADGLRLSGVAPGEIGGAALSTVVPALARPWAGAIRMVCGCGTLLVGPGVRTGLNLRVEQPSGVGPDFVCGAVGALALCPPPLAVFDFGTATTLAALDASGALVGRLILAGVQSSLDALGARAARLPAVTLPAPDEGGTRPLLGGSTAEAMENGALYGAAAMVDGLAARLRERFGEELRFVFTGGCAAAVAPYCATHGLLERDLLLQGLRLIYGRNRPAAV